MREFDDDYEEYEELDDYDDDIIEGEVGYNYAYDEDDYSFDDGDGINYNNIDGDDY